MKISYQEAVRATLIEYEANQNFSRNGIPLTPAERTQALEFLQMFLADVNVKTL